MCPYVWSFLSKIDAVDECSSSNCYRPPSSFSYIATTATTMNKDVVTTATHRQLLDELIIASSCQHPSTALTEGPDVNDGGANHERRLCPNASNRLNDILRAADFLYPPNILQGALTLLDQASTANHPNKIRKLISVPSQRHLYVIHSSRSFYQAQQQQQPHLHQQPPCTICFFPEGIDDSSSSSSSHHSQSRQIYCSCSSFFERNNRHRTNDSDTGSPTVLFCKHLLALQLLPLIQMIQQEQTLTLTSTPQEQQQLKHMMPKTEMIPDQDFCQRVLPYMFSVPP